MKKITITLSTIAAFAPLTVYGITPGQIGENTCKINPQAIGCGTKPLLGSGSVFQQAINAVIYIVAAISVLMIVLGGLRYVLSGGDSAGIRSAKDTIIYAVVGLVIAMMAFGIVNFVIGRF